MIFDPKKMSPGEIYRFMIRVIVPRPIAFISTISREGGFNVAPFSYFTGVSSDPPLLGVSITRRAARPKDTLRNIQETGEFVVNVVPEALAERMVKCSGDWPEDVDEFELTGLTAVPSDLVTAPCVGESPVSLECRLYRVVELGITFFVVGEILRAHVQDGVLTDGQVDPEKLRPVGRLGGAGYTIVREAFDIERPKVRPQSKP